jgi:tetraacyldisaccharide 4'-kinase
MNRSLLPLAGLYAAGARLRRRAFERGWLKSSRLFRPVISVGNLTVGGSGKTPLVALIAETLLHHNFKPAILTRGYGRERAAALIALGPRSHQAPDALTVGDEPALLARSLPQIPIIICADRFRAGQFAEERFEVDLHILDDGFQHLSLARDLDLVAIDVTQNVLDDAVLPAGRLREPASALARADVIVLTRTEIRDPAAIEKQVREVNASAPIFACETRLHHVIEARSGHALDAEDYRRRPVCAFCAIGNPAAFFSDLRRWGFNPVAEVSFRDHHVYAREDIRRINSAASEKGATAFITTEKDMMNIGAKLEFELPLLACAVRAEISERDQFEQVLLAGIERNRVGSRIVPEA